VYVFDCESVDELVGVIVMVVVGVFVLLIVEVVLAVCVLDKECVVEAV
jgi:hypothetical protein